MRNPLSAIKVCGVKKNLHLDEQLSNQQAPKQAGGWGGWTGKQTIEEVRGRDERGRGAGAAPRPTRRGDPGRIFALYLVMQMNQWPLNNAPCSERPTILHVSLLKLEALVCV